MATPVCGGKNSWNDYFGVVITLQKGMAILLDCALVLVHCLFTGRAVFCGIVCISLAEFYLTRGCGEKPHLFCSFRNVF
jgi:hypothetical protein